MSEFLSPGIFIEEASTTGETVSGVGTSTAAFVGWTKMGPDNEARLVTSPEDFSRRFGGFTKDSLVPLSVSAFFSNGGSRAYVVRVVPTDAEAATSSIDSSWDLSAANDGAWGDRLKLRVTGNENFFVTGKVGDENVGNFTKFDVFVLIKDEITGQDVVRETYEEVSFDDEDDAMFFGDVINESSDFVEVEDLGVHEAPSDLEGEEHQDEEIDGTGGDTNYTHTLDNTPVVKTSVEIKVDGSVVATADVNGNLTGATLDETEENTVDYSSGEIVLNFESAPNGAITVDYVSRPEDTSVDYEFSGGEDGTLPVDANVVSSPALEASKRGMYALNRVDEMMMLAMPDFVGDDTVVGHQFDYVESRRDMFAILSIPKGFGAQQAADHVRISLPRRSRYAAWYWPHVTVADPLNVNRILTVPPVGHIAGVYARTDQSRNVGKAPGGTVDGALRFLTGLEMNPNKGERDTVYPARVNPLINTPQTGMAVWGVRTVSATNDAFRYVNSTRLFQFVEKSVFNSTHSLVFENVGSSLYSRIKTQLDGFLEGLFENGYFAGETPNQAFFVIVDDTNNPPEVVNAGQVVVDVGIAPNRPGEFIRFRFAEKTLNS